MVRLRRVSLERRQGNLEEAEALLLEAMRANEGLPLASFYAVKLARQACKVQKNLGKARKVLVEALEKDPVRQKGSLGRLGGPQGLIRGWGGVGRGFGSLEMC